MAEVANTMRAMGGGNEQFNYDNHSDMQMKVFLDASPVLLKFLSTHDFPGLLGPDPAALHVADLGCSTGKNSLACVSRVIEAVRAGLPENGTHVDVQAFFSDLPSNDFNQLFQNLPGGFFAAGVPGSFYERLLPRRSVHVLTTNIAAHWLSVLPPEITDPASPAYNNGSVWYTKNPKVAEAYAAQSRRDLQTFLTCRAAEIMPGGVLWVLVAGREGELADMSDRPGNIPRKWCDLVDDTWQQLIEEGQLEAATLDSFNVQIFHRSCKDIEEAVESLPGRPFRIESLGVTPTVMAMDAKFREDGDAQAFGHAAAGVVLATLEPTLAGLLGASKFRLLTERMPLVAAANPAKYIHEEYRYCYALMVRNK